MSETDTTDSVEPTPSTAGQVITAALARGLIRGLGGSLRLDELGTEHLEAARSASPSGHVVFAFWHGRQFPLVYDWRRRGVAILTSLSRDGTFQSMILGGLGYHIVRGSTSRGAVRGLVGMIRTVREGRDSAFAVDGPRGPYHVVRPGVLYLAAKTGNPIVPITSAVRRARVFDRAWDRYILPLPFTSGVIAYGPAISAPTSTEADHLDDLGSRLGEQLEQLTRQAEDSLPGRSH